MINKLKITDERLIVVSKVDSDRHTADHDGSTYAQFGLVRNSMNSIADSVYELMVGEAPDGSLVEAETIQIGWNESSVDRVKVSGTITRSITTPEGSLNVTSGWKTKNWVVAEIDTETESGAEILTKVAQLATVIAGQSSE